jgi:hypothetical protein
MRNVLLVLLVACGDNVSVKPDAAPDAAVAVDASPDALPIPVGAHTWQWAWDYYATAWCAWYDGCDPANFAVYYGTLSECVDANSGFCDGDLGYTQCKMEYPPEREPIIMQCAADFLALACDAYPDVPSCDQAFAP